MIPYKEIPLWKTYNKVLKKFGVRRINVDDHSYIDTSVMELLKTFSYKQKELRYTIILYSSGIEAYSQRKDEPLSKKLNKLELSKILYGAIGKLYHETK